MSKLELDFLGMFRDTLKGVPADSFESNKVSALLVYPAVEAERPHAREALATLLWSEWPDSDTHGDLPYALTDLRKAIGDRHIDSPTPSLGNHLVLWSFLYGRTSHG